MWIKVGSDVMITAFRLMVKRGVLPSDRLVIHFGIHEILVDSDGNFLSYPSGYPSVHSDILLELL